MTNNFAYAKLLVIWFFYTQKAIQNESFYSVNNRCVIEYRLYGRK